MLIFGYRDIGIRYRGSGRWMPMTQAVMITEQMMDGVGYETRPDIVGYSIMDVRYSQISVDIVTNGTRY